MFCSTFFRVGGVTLNDGIGLFFICQLIKREGITDNILWDGTESSRMVKEVKEFINTQETNLGWTKLRTFLFHKQVL